MSLEIFERGLVMQDFQVSLWVKVPRVGQELFKVRNPLEGFQLVLYLRRVDRFAGEGVVVCEAAGG